MFAISLELSLVAVKNGHLNKGDGKQSNGHSRNDDWAIGSAS